jgi:hypothetical protein
VGSWKAMSSSMPLAAPLNPKEQVQSLTQSVIFLWEGEGSVS